MGTGRHREWQSGVYFCNNQFQTSVTEYLLEDVVVDWQNLVLHEDQVVQVDNVLMLHAVHVVHRCNLVLYDVQVVHRLYSELILHEGQVLHNDLSLLGDQVVHSGLT